MSQQPQQPESDNPIRAAITEAIDENQVILFMKGTPDQPACGFSARTVAALQSLQAPFAAVDILPDPRIRQELSAAATSSRRCTTPASWQKRWASKRPRRRRRPRRRALTPPPRRSASRTA